MEFEWDEIKNQKNFEKHGIYFEEAKEIFDTPVLTRIDDRFEYDEIREVSLGAIEGQVVLLVAHTDRGNATRIISARKANPKERRYYHAYLKETFR